MAKKVTIQMIAEKAGVSRGTVDRVINNRGLVKHEVREKILKTMQELEYRPLHLEQARALGMVSAKQVLRLGMLLPDWGGHFLKEVSAGIDTAKGILSDIGVEILVEKCESELPGECVERMDYLVERGAAGIAVCNKNHPSIAAKINECIEKGIPVVSFNSDIPESNRLCFIGEDVRRSGRVAAELMSKCVSKSAHIVAAVGNLEFNAHKERLQGFFDRLQELGFATGNIEIVQTYNDYALSATRIGEMLRKFEDIEGIYMANHSVTGCAEALIEAGKQGQVCVITHDLTEGAKRLLKDGAVDFVVGQDLQMQGYRPLMLLSNVLKKGQEAMLTDEAIPPSIICAQNITE